MNPRLSKIQDMMRWQLENQPGNHQIKSGLKTSELRALGLQHFDGRWTHQIVVKGAWKTFEILPKAGK